MGLEIAVRYKARSEMVQVLASSTVACQICVTVDLSGGDVRQVSSDIKSECTEVADVNTAASSQIVVQVLDHGFPDDQHLCLGFKWLLTGTSSFGRIVMLAWVCSSIL